MSKGKKKERRARPAPTPPPTPSPPAPPQQPSRAGLWAGLAAAALAVAAGAWWFLFSRPASAPAPTQNVLLISVDTLRADHLGCYGGTTAPTETIDELARTGALFEHATSSAPMTLPAHASILTGLAPPRHGARLNQGHVLPEDVRALAEILRDRGYQTGGFVSGVPLQRPSGMAQGFDYFDDELYRPGANGVPEPANERHAGDVLQRAQQWLATTDPARPVFAFVHIFDPHEPYEKPLPGQAGGSYAGEVAYVDRALGDFFDVLSDDPRLAGMLTVLTSDHGEALGEHGESTHGFFVYQATLDVPLILHWPGRIAPARIEAPVGTVDIMPTVLDLLDLPLPPGLDGRSTRALLAGGAAEDRDTYFECLTSSLSCGWAPLRGVRVGSLKYIAAPRPELYDLAEDPREERNVVATRAQDAASLAAKVADFGEGRRAEARLDPETAQGLASLGYVGAGSAAAPPGSSAIDPKDRVRSFERLQEAHRESFAGRTRQALAILQSIEADFAQSPYYYARRGSYEMALRDLDAAIQSYERVLVLDPGNADAGLAVGVAHARQGRFDLAHADLSRLLAEHPDHAEGHLNLAEVIVAASGPIADAVAHYRRFLELAPRHARAQQARAAILKYTGQ